APYEEPEKPELVINTSEVTDVTTNAKRVIQFLEENKYLNAQ
ncbi:MAG: adenylyl-sulfate kinase, partial [Aliifodinibius sp.]|nr:adenylyl-sulfate kinase [Fodinibius sp.]NIV14594.1 adenylyl-sulfate kinase [Fodinibius sp.]NIY28445.1 adenylyl-sulfate kinase [Fodinibius sp.]